MFDDIWFYKAHLCEIWIEEEDDCRKASFFVTPPNGNRTTADLNPYCPSQEVVNLWIDLDFPKRQGIGPLNLKQLQEMAGDRHIVENASGALSVDFTKIPDAEHRLVRFRLKERQEEAGKGIRKSAIVPTAVYNRIRDRGGRL